MTITPQMHWLLREEDRALCTQVMLGDDIALAPEGPWFTPAQEGSISGGAHVLMLRYESGSDRLTFCLPLPPHVGLEDVRALRALAAPERAEQIWGPFVARLGHALDLASTRRNWVEKAVGWGSHSVWTRRRQHPNLLIDRLGLREREAAVGWLWRAGESRLAAARER